jgi:hypothetical protein
MDIGEAEEGEGDVICGEGESDVDAVWGGECDRDCEGIAMRTETLTVCGPEGSPFLRTLLMEWCTKGA